ncbi:4967_t:CDS:2 [Diversispora eburnea]|uniref:4967_t:CDS:1 n=1 Tax=Diversispora eburnea TaxID=1213867 RepID=A0A9N8YSD0_9GLOM|nr:4967_t:CDS:2 [Diversispora eburnea]
MAYRPSYTMGAICAVGGVVGYVTKRSVPSLIAGLGIGALYVLGGMIPRTIKRGTPIPLSLSILSVGMGTYYTKKIYDQRFND